MNDPNEIKEFEELFTPSHADLHRNLLKIEEITKDNASHIKRLYDMKVKELEKNDAHQARVDETLRGIQEGLNIANAAIVRLFQRG